MRVSGSVTQSKLDLRIAIPGSFFEPSYNNCLLLMSYST